MKIIWTKETPTEPGFYLAKIGEITELFIEVFQQYNGDTQYTVHLHGQFATPNLDLITEWFGPIAKA